MTDTNQLPQIPDLTNERIDYIADLTVKGMPDGIRGFLVSWGWRQFARALMSNFDETMRAYALQARALVHPAQAEVTPEEVMRAAKEATAPEWQDVVDGWHMGLDLMKFTSLILALRPVQVPMTPDEIVNARNEVQAHSIVSFAKGVRAAEAHHFGITAQAKKEKP